MIDYRIQFANRVELFDCKRFDFEHISETDLVRAIEDKRIVLAKVGSEIIGYLRWDYIWCTIPYIELIVLEEEYRGKGIGKSILAFVIKRLKDDDKSMVLTSSQSNESGPQSWNKAVGFRKIGFLDSLNNDGSKEVFYRKDF